MNKYISMYFLIYLSLVFGSYSIKQEISLGYDNNFMRFSDLELNASHLETGTENDYLGDSKTYDSGIVSYSAQLVLDRKIFDNYKTNFVSKIKYNLYTSSEEKSYASFLGRLEFKLASYSWLKLSYSIIPKYYLRTYIDRDNVSSSSYFPCYFSNENFYVSYSHKLPIKKTWIDYRVTFNNQFYNERFSEYDSKIIGFEGTIKSKRFKNYYTSITYLFYDSKNITYNNPAIFESTKMDRSYKKTGFKINIKMDVDERINNYLQDLYLPSHLISSIAMKFYFNTRFYDLDSWYYESDNWKIYNDYDFRLELSKKINNELEVQILGRYFFRNVSSSGSDEIIWIEDYKNHNRSEFWLKFFYKLDK